MATIIHSHTAREYTHGQIQNRTQIIQKSENNPSPTQNTIPIQESSYLTQEKNPQIRNPYKP